MSDQSPEPLLRTVATVTGATPEGWRALTDAGVEMHIPRTAPTRLRDLQPGQRVSLDSVDGVVVRARIG